jgi:hypothetical protein
LRTQKVPVFSCEKALNIKKIKIKIKIEGLGLGWGEKLSELQYFNSVANKSARFRHCF